MAENTDISWNFCKLVEEQENGELKLLTDNLTQLMSKLNKPEFRDVPIVLLGISGAKQSGKSFYTNLIAEYLKYNGKSWAKPMKEGGLKGFAFGSGEMRVSAEKVDGIFEPGDREPSGVYFWPELFMLEQCTGKKLLWIMHMYQRKYEQNISDGPVINFVKVVSSRLVDIIWTDESVPDKFCESAESHPLSSNFCQSKVSLVRGSPAKQALPQDVNQTSSVVKISEFQKPIHDHKGIVNLGMKQLSVENFIKVVINDHDLQPATFKKEPNSKLFLNLIEMKLKFCVDLINSKKSGGNSSSVPVQSEGIPDLQQNAATTATSFEMIPKVIDNQPSGNHGEDISRENKNIMNIPAPNQSKCEVEQNPFEDTHEDRQLNAQDKLLRKYSDEKYLSSHNWKPLKKALKRWIHRKLTCESVSETINMNAIAANVAEAEIDNLKLKGVPPEEAIEVVQNAKVEDKILKFKPKIESLLSGLVKFCSEMDDQFHNIPYFLEADLYRIIEQTKTKIRDSLLVDDFRDLFDAGCKKLVPEFVERNAKIEKEAKLVLESQQQIVMFYQEEMGQVLKSEKFQIPAKLQNIHSQLVVELHRVFKESVVNDSSALETLIKLLEKEFQTIRQKNVEKITSLQRRISNLIVQMKNDYEIEMDALLENNENGVETSVFGAEHDRAKTEVIKRFQELLGLEVSPGEPMDTHLKTLAAHVNKSRESFEEENEMKLTGSSEKCEKEKESPAVASQSTKPVQDQPLLFHLTYSKIGVGVTNANLIGDSDVIYVPAFVALTTKKDWVIGDDEHVKAASDNCIANCWAIGEFFRTSPNHQPGRETIYDEVEVGSESLKISLQFLLAMFFANYKLKLEQHHKRTFSAAMIVVPFWFPSLQRRQILEATVIAGFDSANLFNENSSAAYFMYSSGFIDSKTSQHCNAVIISENSNRVDMSVYVYSKKTRKLKLKMHTGDYEEDLKKVSTVGGAQSWPLIGLLISILKAIGNQMRQKSAQENAVKRLKEKLTHLCARSNEVVVLTEITDWIPLLREVAGHVSPYSIRHQYDSRFAILGLVSILKIMHDDNRESRNIIEDGIPFYLNVYPPNGLKREELQRKADTLAKTPKYTHEAIVEVYNGTYQVIQENSSWRIPVGMITLINVRAECTHFKISMERTQDGIFELKNVEWLQFTKLSNMRIDMGEMESEEYRWDALKMSTDRLNRYSFYLNSIYPNSGRLAKLKELKEKAISCAQELEQAIVTEGKGSFPNEMVKVLALKNIREAGAFLEGIDVSEDDVKQKNNILKRLKGDYNIL